MGGWGAGERGEGGGAEGRSPRHHSFCDALYTHLLAVRNSERRSTMRSLARKPMWVCSISFVRGSTCVGVSMGRGGVCWVGAKRPGRPFLSRRILLKILQHDCGIHISRSRTQRPGMEEEWQQNTQHTLLLTHQRNER